MYLLIETFDTANLHILAVLSIFIVVFIVLHIARCGHLLNIVSTLNIF